MPMQIPCSQKRIFISECLTIFHVYKTRGCCLEPKDSSPFLIQKIYWLLTDNGWRKCLKKVTSETIPGWEWTDFC